MSVVKNPTWVAAVVLAGGETHYFCTNQCALIAARTPMRVLGVAVGDIQSVHFADYGRPGQLLASARAYLLAGSDVVGPMGREIIAMDDPKSIEVLKLRHGGTIVRDSDIDEAWLSRYRQGMVMEPSR